MIFTHIFSAFLYQAVHPSPVAISTAKESSNVDLPLYYPTVQMSTFSINRTNTRSKIFSDSEDAELAKSELLKNLNFMRTKSGSPLTDKDLDVRESYRDSAGVFHVYARELVNGIPIDNRNAAIHIQDQQVLTFSSSLTDAIKISSSRNTPQTLSLQDCVVIAEKKFGIKRDSFPETTVYIALRDHSLSLAYQFQLRNDAGSKWLQVSVDSTTGQIVQVVDYVSNASYKALSLPKVDPSENFVVENSPAFSRSSPYVWHSSDAAPGIVNDTQGNNVHSSIAGITAEGTANLDFSHGWDPNQNPTAAEGNRRAAIINSFFTSNVLHDIFYQYGFDEVSGNFQQNNFGKGGIGSDRVLIINQDTSDSNNAQFSTPPDGQNPVMNMFTYNNNRDPALDNEIIIHEYAHGISHRLTGGSTQANCLSNTISRGMGEGWSDAIAIYLSRKENNDRHDDVYFGTYVENNANGMRSLPYSTRLGRNSRKFSYIGTVTERYYFGEYWANVLFEMYWNLVDAKGFSSNWYDATQDKGNIIALQLVIGGMKLQPCNPTFLNARNAILAADQSYYGGAYRCQIWKAFAKRGMGVDATESESERVYVNNDKIPDDCSPPPLTPVLCHWWSWGCTSNDDGMS